MDQTVKEQAFVLKALLAAAHVVTSVAAIDTMSRAGLGFDYGRAASCALAMSQISLASMWIVAGQTRPLFRWGTLFGLFAFWLPQLWRDLDDNYVLLNNLIWQ